MDLEQPDYHAFLVRIWRGPQGWQGEVHSLAAATTLTFAGWPELLHQLEVQLPILPAPAKAPPTPEDRST